VGKRQGRDKEKGKKERKGDIREVGVEPFCLNPT